MEVLESELATKSSALDVAVFEMASLRSQVEELENKLAKAEAENRQLIDRWMLQKMQDAEKLNEANAMYEDMMERLKSSRLEEFARQQVDGIVRHSEAGAEHYMKLRAPTSVRHTVRAHEGGCSAVQFEHHSSVLMTGGNDLVVKFWDSVSANCVNVLRGTVGSILDLAISFDNKLVLGACSDNKVYQWDVQSGRIRHILTGHTEKVCAVDFSKATSRRAVSAAYDRTIKSWDLVTGYCTNTTICFSNCNSLCLTSDGLTLCSGHVDGNMRFWDLRSGKLANEVAAHSQGITSVSISQGGFMILTSGRDNVLNMFDLRTLEVCDSFRAAGYRVPTNWNRSAMSADESYVASGSVDGSVYVWRRDSHEVEVVLKAHTCPVLTCSWSDVSKSLATGDKNGSVCLWE